MDFLDDIIRLIDDAISDDADVGITSGNIIKAGYNPEIDNQRNLIEQSEAWISEYQKKLILETEIQNLKIKFSSAQ